MKTPRIDAFIQNKKQPPELKSSLDNMPTIEKPVHSSTLPPTQSRTTLRPSTRRKIKTRHPFDIFEDQIEELRKYSIEEKTRGEKGSMSEMAREALDMYIAKRRGR